MNITLIVAIVIIVLLIGLFFVSFVMNKKTPIPENCRHLANEEACEACNMYDCAFNKINEVIKEENKK